MWKTEEEFTETLDKLLKDMFSFEIKIGIKYNTDNMYKINIQFNEGSYDTILSTTIEYKN